MNEDVVSSAAEFDRHYAAEQVRRSRHPFRRIVKGFYLREVLRDVVGPSIDFGCGAGQLLERLPAGSVGLEVNVFLIEALRARGLKVHQATAEMRDFLLQGVAAGSFRTLVIAHVLEHLPDPAAALHLLLASCRRLGIVRVIVVVPGAKGFASDQTHKTFIDASWVHSHLSSNVEGFQRSAPTYFPGSWAWIGRYFVFHEMKLVFDRPDADQR